VNFNQKDGIDVNFVAEARRSADVFNTYYGIVILPIGLSQLRGTRAVTDVTDKVTSHM